MKSFPDTEGYKETRKAFDRAKEPTSLSQARKALADAVRRADEQYKIYLIRLGRAHGVSVGIHDPRTV